MIEENETDQRLLEIQIPAKTDISPNSSDSSSDDLARKELLWETREEILIVSWTEQCSRKSLKHHESSLKFKQKYHIWGALSVILPVIFTGLTQLPIENYIKYISSTGFIITGIVSAICVFFDFNSKRLKHFEYSAKYDDLGMSMRAELTKPKKHRIACDVYLARCEMQLSSLNRSSPELS